MTLTGHEWVDCPNTPKIANLEGWQERQDIRLDKNDNCLVALKAAEARRSGAESMLRWVLGFAITGAVSGVISLIVNLSS